MCRGQRENHKLSAVPCCGKKKCEELYLRTVPITISGGYSATAGTPFSTVTRDLGEAPLKDIYIHVSANGIGRFIINGVDLTRILYGNRQPIITIFGGCIFNGGGNGTVYNFYMSRRSLESLGIEFPDNKIIIQYQIGNDDWGCRTGIFWDVTLYYE